MSDERTLDKYADGMIRFLMAGLGQNAYHIAVHGSSFNPETLDIEGGFTNNHLELKLLEVRQDFGLVDVDSEVGEPYSQ